MNITGKQLQALKKVLPKHDLFCKDDGAIGFVSNCKEYDTYHSQDVLCDDLKRAVFSMGYGYHIYSPEPNSDAPYYIRISQPSLYISKSAKTKLEAWVLVVEELYNRI